MSELANKIIESITNAEDISKVLRDVAIALKSTGFFDNSNWSDELIKNFKDVIDAKVDDSISCITDNEHEISSSFITDESSKFKKKSKTTITTRCESILNDDMFEDSNDSFEIPETQPFPAIDHPNDDELDSEGFITMPDDGYVANDCSQSQVLLQGAELGMQTPLPPDFDDSDTVDMEMSKLQWDDSTKENDKNKSASVTPELMDVDLMMQQAAVKNADLKRTTSDNAYTKPVTIENADTKPAEIDSTDEDFETQDLDFGAILVKSKAVDFPQSFTLSKVPYCLGRNETKNSPIFKSDKFSTREPSTSVERADGGDLGIEEIELDNREISANGKCDIKEELPSQKNCQDEIVGDEAKICKDEKATNDDKAAVQAAEEIKAAEDVQPAEDTRAAKSDVPEDVQAAEDVQPAEDTRAAKSNVPVENFNHCDDEMPETEFFSKSGDDIENRADVEVPEDQLFKKPGELAAGKITESKRVSDVINDDADDVHENLEETQLFFKPNASSTEEDDAYDAETQALDVLESSPSNKNQTSLPEDGPKDDGNNKQLDVINVDVATNEISEDSEEPKPKLRKRNRLIESSDEEDDAADRIDYEAPTQKFVTRKYDKRDLGATDGVDPDAYTQRIGDNPDHMQRPPKCDAKDVGADDTHAKKCDEEDGAADYDAHTQIFETRKPETPRRKRVSELKGGDWEQFCEAANSNQANVVFKSVFDQCKDLRQVHENNATVASVANQNVVAEAPIGQSARSRAKAKYPVSNDAEPTTSKRPKLRTEPIQFKVPLDTVPTKSDNAPPQEVKTSEESSNASLDSTKSNAPLVVKASKNSSKAALASSKQDEADENDALAIAHTQVFVKASSTPKERAKPDLPRRRARATTDVPKPKDVKQPIPKLRAQRQSVAYSPKVSDVKVTSDLNENVDVDDSLIKNIKSEESDKQSSSDVPRQTRKRKASDANVSTDSGANSSYRSRSPSLSRSSRNQNYPVMFTMVDPAPHKATLKNLNISIVTETGTYNVLITDKVYRTSKFMCAVAAGKPIVSIEWLNALKAKKSFIDPFEYLLKDAAGEKKYHFNLAKTLNKVQQNGELFRNHSIFVTPNTSPSPDILKDIIASSGGKYLKTSLSARKNDIVLCISAEEDAKVVTQLKKKYRNLKEITAEQFMQGIFQYKI